MDAPVQELGIDRALLNIKQGHVVVSDFVKLDDELDQIGVRLLPEGLLAFAKEIVQQGRDVISECVGIQIVVKKGCSGNLPAD